MAPNIYNQSLNLAIAVLKSGPTDLGLKVLAWPVRQPGRGLGFAAGQTSRLRVCPLFWPHQSPPGTTASLERKLGKELAVLVGPELQCEHPNPAIWGRGYAGFLSLTVVSLVSIFSLPPFPSFVF